MAFSVVDIIEILTESNIPRRYWSDLKIKLKKEGSQLYEKIVQLKLRSADGKMRLTDIGDSIISPLNAKSLKKENNQAIDEHKE
jgi:hypothetical protein